MKKLFVGLGIAVVFMVITAGDSVQVLGQLAENVGRPILLSPISEEVDLTGQETITFKWLADMGHYVGKDYYDFRIYKGYNMGEDTLVFQQKVESRRGMLDVETALFENGETYTWSVRHVVNATKSDRGYKSFTVKK